MNSFSNSLTRADKLNIKIRSLMSKLSEATEKKKKYVKFDDINREKFNAIHENIANLNIQVETYNDKIYLISNRKSRSSRKKRTYIQRLIDDAKKKRDALSNRLKKYRQKALEMEKVMYETYKHLTKDKRIVNEINTTQLEIQKLITNSGRGKKTKNRRIKKNQTKTRRRKQTRRKKQKKPKKKKN